MMENSWYSVISPENCSSILWRSWEYKEKAAAALKLTSKDMSSLKLVDGVVPEPLGGAHSDRETTFKTVEETILNLFEELKDQNVDQMVNARIDKYANMGVYDEA